MPVIEGESKRAGDTRERILREAEKLYHEGGYEKISLQEVADALGIKKPALFYHYKNKQELFYAMLKAMIARLNQLMVQAIAQAGPGTRARLQAILQRMTLEPGFDLMHFLQQDYQLLTQSQKEDIERTWFTDFYSVIWQVFKEGLDNKELRTHNPEMSTYMFLNLWMLLPRATNPVTTHNRNRANAAQYIDEMLDLFLNGLL
jgi:AcrR family transcriptional regulator